MNDIVVKGLCHDSRLVKRGDLFIAMPGLTVDGRDFIPAAIAKGAVAVLAEADPYSLPESMPGSMQMSSPKHSVPLIPYENLQQALGPIASRFYADPSKQLEVIGITGTNGKTSCSHFIAELFAYLGLKAGVMGTLGVGYLENLQQVLADQCTTLDAILTQAELKKFYEDGAKICAMEVTSHALSQGRVAGVTFHTTIFTNLTRDHLDYHANMEGYWSAKKKLFLEFKSQYSIINLDDEHGLALFKELSDRLSDKLSDKLPSENAQTLIGYSLRSEQELKSNSELKNNLNIPAALWQRSNTAFITTEKLQLNEKGMQVSLKTPWGSGDFQSTLMGRFNVSNLLAVIATACAKNYSLSTVLEQIPKLKNVSGRMTCLGGGREPLVVVDYAHTPDALSQILLALRPHVKGKLWCVFGCGGDRDPGKRPLMAEIAEKLADCVVVTQDNPRSENPDNIIQDIMRGFKNPAAIHIESDRAKAIQHAILAASDSDLVVVAGKGHEPYQIIKTEKIPFDDQKIAGAILAARTEQSERTER